MPNKDLKNRINAFLGNLDLTNIDRAKLESYLISSCRNIVGIPLDSTLNDLLAIYNLNYSNTTTPTEPIVIVSDFSFDALKYKEAA